MPEHFAAVNVESLARWIAGIDFAGWPQQNPAGQPLKPAMVTDPSWHGFGAHVAPLVAELTVHFPACRAEQQMLSVVMPGDEIPPHRDLQRSEWLTRVHVPLLSNSLATFTEDGVECCMLVGAAYKVNTLAEHSVKNGGVSPRVHFMFDVRRA